MTTRARAASGCRIWLEHYPPGIPAEVDVHAYASLKDMLERSCQRFKDRTAFTSMGVTMSYAELDRHTRAFAACLQTSLGLGKGERVAVMLPNCLQSPVAILGALRAGMVVVNVNPTLTPAELAFQLKDSGAVAIVVLENFTHTLAQALPTSVRHVIVTQLGDLLPHVRRELVNFAAGRVMQGVCLLYTSPSPRDS